MQHTAPPRQGRLRRAHRARSALSWPGSAHPALVLDRPKDPNTAITHATSRCSSPRIEAPPREIADTIVRALPESSYLEESRVAGAGFINLFLKRGFSRRSSTPCWRQPSVSVTGRQGPVSACRSSSSRRIRPPAARRHGRGAAFGASLANVLEARVSSSRGSTTSTTRDGR